MAVCRVPCKLLVWLFLLTTGSPAAAQITVTEIPKMNAGHFCGPSDINELGDVLLFCFSPEGGSYAVAFVDGESVLITSPAGADAQYCVGINDSRQVLCNQDFTEPPFLWSIASGSTRLFLPGAPTSTSYISISINDVGQVLGGFVPEDSSHLRYFVRQPDGHVDFLPDHLTPMFNTDGSGIDNNSKFNDLSEVLVWDLDTRTGGLWSPLGGFAPFSPQAPDVIYEDTNIHGLFHAINDAGQVITRTHRFTPGEGWVPLAPVPSPYGYAVVSDVNSVGQVTGIARTWDSTSHTAVFWPTPDTIVDLGLYQGMPTIARAMNGAGQIVGSAIHDDLYQSVVLLWSMADRPSDAAERVDAVRSWLHEMIASGALSRQTASGLVSTLNAAKRAISGYRTTAARNILTAAGHQVRAMVKSRRLAIADATAFEQLVAAAIESIPSEQ